QPDGGDRLKAAFSDALKRAAVKFGIGRYLYRLPRQWCDYDQIKKQFAATPKLPAFALPKSSADAAKPAEVAKSGKPSGPSQRIKPPAPPTEKQRPVANSKVGLPANGEELHRRLHEKDTQLAREGRCQLGALLSHVAQVGVKAGYGADLTQWSGAAIELAVEETKQFMATLPDAPVTRAAA